MPKPTFDNLPPAKRQAIIDLALAEFAENPYPIASLSRIVERAGIAKGSMYQYFEHKQDLYLFLVSYTVEQQLDLLAKHAPPEPNLGFFALLRWQMHASLQVGSDAPLLMRLLYRAVTDDVPFRDAVMQRLGQAGHGYMRQLVDRGRASGEIDPTLDPDLVAFVMQRLTSDLHSLIIQRLGVSLEQAAADVNLFHNPVVTQIYDQIIRILQFGLVVQPQTSAAQGA
jgi:AcrR family transcriptional regulator